MKVEREKTKQRFAEYVKNYNIEDPKVKLKVVHTYRVAELCRMIADSIGLSREEQDIAWLTGMLHDVGRFEQVRQYNTFVDSLSVDHAKLGCDVLFGTNHTGYWSDADVHTLQKNIAMQNIDESTDARCTAVEANITEQKKAGSAKMQICPGKGMIREFVEDSTEDNLIYTAILNHNTYRIEEGLDHRTETFCNILRDADKIDILRVNIETPLEDIYNCTTEELVSCRVTEEVMESFREHHAVLRSKKKVPVDHVVGHISLTYELVYPMSMKLMAQQGYLEKLMHFQSENPETGKQFEEIREVMHRFLEDVLTMRTKQMDDKS